MGFGPMFEVIQITLHDRQVLDAADHFHAAAALVTGLDVDLEYPCEVYRTGVFVYRAFVCLDVPRSPVAAVRCWVRRPRGSGSD